METQDFGLLETELFMPESDRYEYVAICHMKCFCMIFSCWLCFGDFLHFWKIIGTLKFFCTDMGLRQMLMTVIFNFKLAGV